MSKELEALERILDGTVSVFNLDDYYIVSEFVDEEDLDIIKQALTPPTADEVCKALSEWVDENDNITYPNEIYYDENRKTFYTYNYLDEWTPIVENGKLLYVMIDLPINIHKMVISFYEGETK